MQYLYYSILFILLYVYLGFGLTVMSCPKELKPYSLFLSPVVGYCYLTLVGWYCYQLDLGGTDVYALPLLLPSLFFLFFALLNRRRDPADKYNLFRKELVAPLLVGVIVFIVISIPFIIRTGGLTSMSIGNIGNCDIIESASVSRYLKEFSRSDTVGFLGQSSAFKYLADHLVFGDCLSTAFAGSLFSLQPYQLQSMSIQIFFLFSILLVYALARESFRYNGLPAIGITALYGLSPIMSYAVYLGFHGQIFATSLALFIFFLNLQTIQHCKKFSDYYSYIPLAVLTNLGLSLTYPHMLPFIYILLTAYVLWVSFHNKSISLALQWISFVIVSFVITFALSPYRGTNLVSQFFWAGRTEAGWHIPMFFWNISGHGSKNPYFDLMGYTLIISYIFIMVLGLVDAYKNDRNLFYLAGSSLIMIWTGYIILAFMGRTHLGLGGYKSYKWLSFFLPILLLSSMLLLRNLKFALHRLNGNALSLLLAVLIGCTLFSSFYMIMTMSKFRRAASKDMADLKRIEINPLIQSVNILGKDCWNILWENHFLMRKKIYFETSTYSGHNASNLDGEWDLIRVSPEKDTPSINIPSEKIFFLNSSYILKRAK